MAKRYDEADYGDGVDDLNNMIRGVLEDASYEDVCDAPALYAAIERIRRDCDEEPTFKRLARKVTTALKRITAESSREQIVTALFKVWVMCDGEPDDLSFDDEV